MDSTLSGQVRDGERSKRVCTHSEDERLVESLTEIMVLRKIKCDNGFKPRTFLQVEKLLEEKLLNSGLKASPYMESHVKTLKRQFNVIIDMLTHVASFYGTMKRKQFYVIKIYSKVGSRETSRLSRLDLLKLSQIIKNHLMKVKLLFNLDEDLKVEWVKQLLQSH
ncbi:hypothetical protein CK203_045922 [Vitis vinifera]|uniref:Uncharacterized protein n=1 Tax=Vitis vinifera TaxID=29760 RepID=A0A438I4X3_VITVI|nr:hypothetical protein CK203_045922 [Vitis vinifera]